METPDFDPIFEMRGQIIALHAMCAFALGQVAAMRAPLCGTTLAEELEHFAEGAADAGLAQADTVAALGVPAATAGFNQTIEAMRVGILAMAEASRRGLPAPLQHPRARIPRRAHLRGLPP